MKQFNNNRGFTFIELLLYISIVTIMLSAIIPFAWNIIGSSTKSSTEQEVFSQARYLSERLKYEIRNATGIDVSSNFDINLAADSTKKLALTSGATTNYFCVSTSGQLLTQTSVPPPCSGNTLNSSGTKVTNLTFTNYTSADNKTKHIQFSFTMDDTGASTRKEYQVPAVTIESSAEVRSN